MQAAQYRILQKSIEDTRRARHDLRQHFKALQGCVESGDIDRVAEYVKAYGESLPPDTVRRFCKNYAVDAVLHYYGEQAVRQQTDMEVSVQMKHTMATHMLEAGVPLIVVKNFLGHVSLQTTQIYAEVTQETINKQLKTWNEKCFLEEKKTEYYDKKKEIVPDFLR